MTRLVLRGYTLQEALAAFSVLYGEPQCPECGGAPECVCAELKAAHAAEMKDAQPCCDFCGDEPSWVVDGWTICHRVNCGRRASAGPDAATPWWEAALARR